MTGIYKITCLKTKKVYIGQSVDIKRRWKDHRNISKKTSLKLNNSLRKHGIDNHKFEIVTECEVGELNQLERYYQELFNCIGKHGLNLRVTHSSDKSGYMSEETKAKLKLGRENFVFTPEHRMKISIANSGRVFTQEHRNKIGLAHTGKIGWNLGKPHSADHRRKIGESQKGKIISLEQRAKMSKTKKEKNDPAWNKGMIWSDEVRKNISNGLVGKIPTGPKHHMSKPVLDVQTGIYYDNARQASELLKLNYPTLKGWLNGSYKNKTSLIYA